MSSRNAYVPRIACPSPLLETEDARQLDDFTERLRREFSPRSETEEMIFNDIIRIKWEQRRYKQVEKESLNMAATEDAVVENFSRLEGLALTTQAHRWLCDNSRCLQVINRQLARLDREFHRAMDLYLRLHGPLDPPETTAPSAPPSQPKHNEPIPITEHRPSSPVAPVPPVSLWIRKPRDTGHPPVASGQSRSATSH